MRKAVRFRVLYLLFAIATYTLGFILLPETINSSFDQILSDVVNQNHTTQLSRFL